MTEWLFKRGYRLRCGATCWEQRAVAGAMLWCACRLLDAGFLGDE